jgi:hypothetical protein
MSDQSSTESGGHEAEENEAAQAGREAADEAPLLEETPVYDTESILAQAKEDAIRTRASWSLISRELFVLLFANCLFCAGALASWNRGAPGEAVNRAVLDTGLDTVRGGAIFALALYGFWASIFNVWGRQMIVWPFLLNAMLGLWIGIAGFTRGIGGDAWEAAKKQLSTQEDKTLLDDWFAPLSTIAPGYWLLTAGGILVMVVILKGILGGAAKAKAAAAAGGPRRRR